MQKSDYDFEFEHQLLHDRRQQLNNAHEHMLKLQGIVNETENLTYQQGQKLDIIGDDIFHSYKNMQLSNAELD